jgi:hypothetical protein
MFCFVGEFCFHFQIGSAGTSFQIVSKGVGVRAKPDFSGGGGTHIFNCKYIIKNIKNGFKNPPLPFFSTPNEVPEVPEHKLLKERIFVFERTYLWKEMLNLQYQTAELFPSFFHSAIRAAEKWNELLGQTFFSGLLNYKDYLL